MKVLLVDDERLARVELRRLLASHPVEVVGEADRVADALALNAALRPDLVFLDVQMRGETGFDFLERLGSGSPRVVLVTAHDGFAVRGFDCNALDYLLKPVRPERLEETLRRARRVAAAAEPAPPSVPAADAGVAVIKGAGSSLVVPWTDIGCVQAEGNYTRVILRAAPPRLVLRPLKRWLALAPAGALVQVHRTALVRPSWIREIRVDVHGDRELLLLGGVPVPVGRAFWRQLSRLLAAAAPRDPSRHVVRDA